MSDEALIEAMIDALPSRRLDADEIHALLAVARPIIEAETREECWRTAMQWAESSDTAVEIAAALKEPE